MDIISHGFWGGVTFGRKSKGLFALAFLFGVIPDLFAFSPTFVQRWLLGGDFIRGPIASIPSYVHGLYNISHSLVMASLILVPCYFIWREKMLPLLAWPLHILFDMFSHDLRFFPTPFLWPLPTPFIDGIPWSTPWVFWLNWVSLIILYVTWWLCRKQNKK